MPEGKKFSLIKPTVDTPFHIDFDWWKNHDQNWKVYLQSCMCEFHQKEYFDQQSIAPVDKIDPKTGEVKLVDGLEFILLNHCAKQVDFVTDYTTTVNSVFRIFLANGNSPLSASQLSSITGKSAETILRTLTGIEVYKGIRPVK